MGCSKAMTSSISKRRLPATSRLASSSSPYRRDFAISRYQSHISFQEKRYRALAASANSYFSYSSATSSTTVSRRLNIQRSAGVDNEIQGVHPCAQTLAHPAPIWSQNSGMYYHVLKGDIPGILQAHHNHSGHPQEDNIPSRREYGGGIEGVKFLCLFGPSQSHKRPKGRAKPSVQDVLVLPELSPAVRTQVRRELSDHNALTRLTVPDW